MANTRPVDNIVLKQYEPWNPTYYAYDDNMVTYPLTGYSAKMTIREKPGGRVFLTLTSDGGDITINEAGGAVTPQIAVADYASLNFHKAEYDLWIISPSGVPLCIAEGEVTLVESNTEIP